MEMENNMYTAEQEERLCADLSWFFPLAFLIPVIGLIPVQSLAVVLSLGAIGALAWHIFRK